MEKLIAVFEASPESDLRSDGLLRDLTRWVSPQVTGLTAHVRNLALPREFLESGAFDSRIAFALALWVKAEEDATGLFDPIAGYGALEATYVVVEAVRRDYPVIDWPAGTKSPGVTLFAQFRRRSELDVNEFYRRWHAHSVLSLDMHPLTRYHRNAVLRPLGGNGPSWDAIVEERVGVVEDLRPERFYRGESGREQAVRDLNGFVDLAAGDMRCALLEEYIIKRPAWLAGA